jgi:hypothetical protein
MDFQTRSVGHELFTFASKIDRQFTTPAHEILAGMSNAIPTQEEKKEQDISC